METFEKRNEELRNEAIIEIKGLIDEKGEESEHTTSSCLKLSNEELMFNLEGGRYLTEVHTEHLLDNSGYEYNFHVLEDEQFYQVVDHLIEKYS